MQVAYQNHHCGALTMPGSIRTVSPGLAWSMAIWRGYWVASVLSFFTLICFGAQENAAGFWNSSSCACLEHRWRTVEAAVPIETASKIRKSRLSMVREEYYTTQKIYIKNLHRQDSFKSDYTTRSCSYNSTSNLCPSYVRFIFFLTNIVVWTIHFPLRKSTDTTR